MASLNIVSLLGRLSISKSELCSDMDSSNLILPERWKVVTRVSETQVYFKS